MNKIENSTTSKIKTGCVLEILATETMKLFRRKKKTTIKLKMVNHLEVTSNISSLKYSKQ